MDIRFIDTGFNTPSMNMAIDEALLSSKEPVLRFYGWKPSGLSLGYFQNISDIDLDFCKQNNIKIVRRLTGGNAVLHDDELTYSFIIDENKMPKGIMASYKKISESLVEGLNNLGLAAKMKDDVSEKISSPVCFAEPSWYEIIVNGKKIIGSAQKRINGRILQHGAILMDINLEKYNSCFNKKLNISILENRVTTIKKEIGDISIIRIKEAIRKGFESSFQLKESKLTKEELILAENLEHKYLIGNN